MSPSIDAGSLTEPGARLALPSTVAGATNATLPHPSVLMNSQQVLLSTEPSLWPFVFYFLKTWLCDIASNVFRFSNISASAWQVLDSRRERHSEGTLTIRVQHGSPAQADCHSTAHLIKVDTISTLSQRIWIHRPQSVSTEVVTRRLSKHQRPCCQSGDYHVLAREK